MNFNSTSWVLASCTAPRHHLRRHALPARLGHQGFASGAMVGSDASHLQGHAALALSLMPFRPSWRRLSNTSLGLSRDVSGASEDLYDQLMRLDPSKEHLATPGGWDTLRCPEGFPRQGPTS